MHETPTPQKTLQPNSVGVSRNSVVGQKTSGLAELRSHRGQTLRLGAYQVDVGALKLIADNAGEARRLTPKTMSVLLELALRSGETIARDELLEAVWPNTCPTPEVLTQAIKELRKAFQDDQKAPNYIETVPKIGYRLLKQPIWSEVSEPAIATPEGAVAIVETREPKPELLVAQWPAPAKIGNFAPLSKRVFAVSLLVVIIACAVFLGLYGNQSTHNAERTAQGTAELALRTIVAANSDKLSQIKKSYRQLSSTPGAERNPVISSNGAWLAYSTEVEGHNRVWVRDLATANAQRLTADSAQTHNASEINPHFSADGLEIAYVRLRALASPPNINAASQSAQSDADVHEQCEIIAQRILGSESRKLMDCPEGMMLPFDWPTQNELLFAQRQPSEKDAPIAMGIVSYQLDSGKSLTLVSGGAFNWHPQRSPNGQLLAFRRGVGSDSTLYISDSAGQNLRPLANLATATAGFAWLPDSLGIVAAIASEGEYDLTLLREKQTALALGVLGQTPSVSANGKVVFSVATEQIGLFEFGLKDARAGVRLFPSTSSDGPPSVSPSGEWIAFLSSRGGIGQVWLAGRGGQPGTLQPRAITQFPASFGAMSWHPSSARLLYSALAPASLDSQLFEFELDRSRTRVITVPSGLGLIIRANYDADAIVILSSSRGQRRLQKWQPKLEESEIGGSASALIASNSATRPWRLLWTLENAASFQIDQSTGKLYFTRVGNRTLFERLSDGTEAPRLEQFKPRGFWHWRVAQGLVYYATDTAPTNELRVFDLRAKTDRKIRKMPAGAFALDLAHQSLIVPVSLNDEMDIASVQLQ